MNLYINLPELRRWTVSAAYCYKRGCICRGCLYKEALETKCYMKETVLALYRKFGKPTKAKLKLASVCDEENRKTHTERRKNGENERQIKI